MYITVNTRRRKKIIYDGNPLITMGYMYMRYIGKPVAWCITNYETQGDSQDLLKEGAHTPHSPVQNNITSAQVKLPGYARLPVSLRVLLARLPDYISSALAVHALRTLWVCGGIDETYVR